MGSGVAVVAGVAALDYLPLPLPLPLGATGVIIFSATGGDA